MASAGRVSVIGRSVPDLAVVWDALRPSYRSANLIVSEDPLVRGLEAQSTLDEHVFVVLDKEEDIEQLLDLEVMPEWLFVLCPVSVMQCSFAEPGVLPVRVLALEDVALVSVGRTSRPSLTARHPDRRHRAYEG